MKCYVRSEISGSKAVSKNVCPFIMVSLKYLISYIKPHLRGAKLSRLRSSSKIAIWILI